MHGRLDFDLFSSISIKKRQNEIFWVRRVCFSNFPIGVRGRRLRHAKKKKVDISSYRNTSCYSYVVALE